MIVCSNLPCKRQFFFLHFSEFLTHDEEAWRAEPFRFFYFVVVWVKKKVCKKREEILLTIIIDAPSDKIQSVVGRLTLHFQTGGGQTKLGKENLVDLFVAKQNVNGSPV